MSQHPIFIYQDPAYFETTPPEGWAAVIETHNTFTKQIPELGGSLTGGGALAPTTAATTIKDGTVTDGPFADTKEAFLG